MHQPLGQLHVQVSYLHRSAAALVATPPQAALPLFAVDKKKQRRCRFSLLIKKNSGASANAAAKTAALCPSLLVGSAILACDVCQTKTAFVISRLLW